MSYTTLASVKVMLGITGTDADRDSAINLLISDADITINQLLDID